MIDILRGLRPLFNGHFIDVGVNIGQTLIKVNAVFNDVNYIGFEPNPSCVHYVYELLRINKLVGYQIFPLGIGNKSEVLKLNFFSSDKSDSSASIIQNYRPNHVEDHFIYVPIYDNAAIRRFLPSKETSIVKIDVEGAELEVLLGLVEWIKEFAPIIILEILPVYAPKNTTRLNRQLRIEDLFRSLDYKIARVIKEGSVQLELIDEIGIHSSLENSDYIVFPSRLGNNLLKGFGQ
jgi:FkbM family methyltransferase